MKHTVSEVAPCRKKIEVAYEADEVNAAYDEMYTELRDDVVLRGFRRGRAPRKLLENKFAKPVAQDVSAKLISSALEKIMEEDDVNPMAEPSMTPEKPAAEPGQAFAFVAEVDVRPTFELGEYKGLALEEPSTEPTDAEIDERMESYRQTFAERTDVDEPAAPGDMVQVDASVKVGDEEITKLEDQWVKVDGEKLFDLPCPELVATMTGIKKGDVARFKIVLPDTHPKEELRGKDADVALTAKQVQRVTLPALDDAFAGRVHLPSMAAFRETVAEHVRRDKEEARFEALQEQLIDQLIARNPFDLPAEYLERQTQSQMMQQWLQYAQMGVSQDFLRENADNMRTQTRERTERGVRWSIISDAIADQEKIEISQEEIQGYIDELAERENVPPAQVVEAIRGRKGGMYAVAAQLRDVRIVRFLIENGTVTPAAEGMSAEAKAAEERQKK